MQSEKDPFGDNNRVEYQNEYTLWLTAFVVFGSAGYAVINADHISGFVWFVLFFIVPYGCCLLNGTTNVKKKD